MGRDREQERRDYEQYMDGVREKNVQRRTATAVKQNEKKSKK